MQRYISTTNTSVLGLSLLALFNVHAAEPETNELATVQVWGTQVKSSSEFIDDTDIEVRQADHLSDLLRDLPGVDIGGAHSTNQRINIRGLQDTDLEITIDGARQNNFMYHHMGNLLINADILKAVDVQVGTNSVINGGLGGGMAFETKDAQDLLPFDRPIGARVYGAFASNDYFGYSATGYGQLNEQFDILAYYHGTSRNNPEYGNGIEAVGNNGDIANGLFKIGMNINDENRLELTYDQYTDEGNYAPRADMGAATNSAITGAIVYPTEFERTTLTLNYELDLGDAINLRASIYRNEMDLWRDEDSNPYKRGPAYRYASGNSIHTGGNILAETFVTTGALEHTFRYGLDIYKQDTEYKRDTTVLGEESARSTAVYVEDEMQFGRFSVTPGLRYNRYTLDSKVADKTYNKLTWGLEAAYAINQQWTLNASTTRLFKGPMLAEVFTGAGANLDPNPDLKPTTGTNNQFSVLYNQQDALGEDSSLNASLTIFRTNFKDYIDDEGTGSYVNLGNYDVDGFEASVNMRKGQFSARLSYSQSESENEITGEPLGRQVGDSISLALGYSLPNYGLSFNWQSLVTQKEDYYNKPSYDVHNISVNWIPVNIENLSITLGVENLFDEHYVSHASRIGDDVHPLFGPLHLNDYEPGRNIKLSLSYAF
ncbi:TonB-dependent receptor [Candidatus Albibeggiatoa sp. nov. NOAA]|uniref:TonB-dependent receptor domain-containing protein n=1 Tax=Candidatus Albibeggiatoa sp. nov. NOAA TaxID=3162724 RepID=UPI0032F3E060|nr:TonB-dependent receptor [Thiotrichaceae bacterium]